MVQILFVCLGNIFRSQLAAAFFNKYSNEKAVSAGVKPGKTIPLAVKEIAVEENLKLDIPKKLSDEIIKNADKIILLDSSIKLKTEKEVERWKILDTHPNNSREIRKIKEKIKRKVLLLVKTLKTNLD